MSFRRVVIACALMAALISGCGIAKKPMAGSPHLLSDPGFHGKYDDQRTKRTPCLAQHHIPYSTYLTTAKVDGTPQMLQAIKIKPGGATIVFYPDAGVAEGQIIMGHALGAELIGSALLYPNNTTGETLTEVEDCTAIDVD